MTRYRPPKAARSPYITPEGAAQLGKELEELWRVERPLVTAAVTAAAALGDRSENADYHYGKKRLRQIDSRVRFITKRLEEVTVVQPLDREDGKVYFGAWARLENSEGEEVEYRIVGPDESDASKNKISMDSPIGKALLGKSEGDEITVKRPKGVAVYELVRVRYSVGKP